MERQEHGTTIVAGEVRVRAAAVRSVTAGDVEVRTSALQHVAAESVAIRRSSVALAGGSAVDVEHSQAFAIAGRDVRLANVRTVLLLAPRVRGEVRTLVDWKTAAGIGIGIVLGRRLLKLLRIG